MHLSGYGAAGSALVWGARGRVFKSRYSDQPTDSAKKLDLKSGFFLYIEIIAVNAIQAAISPLQQFTVSLYLWDILNEKE